MSAHGDYSRTLLAYIDWPGDNGDAPTERRARLLYALDDCERRLRSLDGAWARYQQRTSWPQLSVYDVHIDPPTDR